MNTICAQSSESTRPAQAAEQCLTTERILFGGAAVLFAYHSEHDGLWHFHQGGPVYRGEMKSKDLHALIEMDPTLASVMNLPLGWYAERQKHNSEWIARRVPVEEFG
jgi:hypothetical protein